jgi:pyrroline-5-carboxylate reductase
MRIGILGATGWLGSALGAGLLRRGFPAGDLVLLNRSGPRARYHGRRGVAWARDPDDLAARADVVVVSVRPEEWPGLALRAPGRLLVSFMACVPMATLAETGARVVRAMPHTGAEAGRSYTPWLAGAEVTAADREAVATIVHAIGTGDEVASEAEIDFLTALSGSGSAYPALMAAAMLDAAGAAGLDRAVAERAVAAVICDGGAMLEGRIGDAEAMLEAYRSYRGPTAAGLAAAEAAGFGRIVAAALAAATRAAAAGPRSE